MRTSSSRGKPYRVNGDHFLERIRHLAFAAILQLGWKIRGQIWRFSSHAAQILEKPGLSDVLPDDLYDAIALNAPQASAYINPYTGTQVIVGSNHTITDVIASNKQDASPNDTPEKRYSSDLPHICGIESVPDKADIIIKRYGYVVQAGMGSALSGDVIIFRGKEIRINNDLVDPYHVNPKAEGRSNLELMKQGYAPYGYDDQKVNLHHVDQTPDGPLQEMSRTYHSKNYRALHQNTGQSPSLIDRSKFAGFRSAYWAERAKYFDD